MGKSDKCPICRLKVDRISKNHTIGSLIDAFIVNNPDKTRSKEDIKELDEKNKITHDMVRLTLYFFYVHSSIKE